MNYGYLDESGDANFGAGATENLIAVVVVVGHPERLRKAVKRTRRAFGRRLRDASELKASRDSPRVIRKLLRRAVGIGFQGVAVVADKRRISPLADPETLYRQVCARAVREALERYGSLEVTLDRRYVNRKQRGQLEDALLAGLEWMPGVTLTVDFEDSEKEKCLQIADAVACTVYQRYERDDERLWEVIRESVVVVSA